MRYQTISAPAALSDEEYQQRVWIRREYPRAGYFDDFTLNIHVLYDDCVVIPDPARKWSTAWSEIVRLHALDQVLGPLLHELGDASDATYLADPRWPTVRVRAGTAVMAMILAGGFALADPEDETGK